MVNGFSNGYSRSNYSRGGSNGYERRDQKKHSGAKFMQKDDALIVSAWNYSRSRGLITLYARPCKTTKYTQSKSGKTWVNLFVTVVYRKTGQVLKTSALVDVNAKKLYLKELNMVCTSRGNGGYLGKHISK